MLFDPLCTILMLIAVHLYVPAAHVAVKLTEEVARVRFNPGHPAANTWGATPRKDQAQVVGKGKSKQMNKGKGKMIEPEKLKKAAPFPLQTGGVFKIHDKDLAPLALAVIQPVKREKKPTEAPPRVARVLKLVDDKDDLEVGEPAEVISVPVQKAPTLEEESKVKVIKAHLARKRILKKATDVAIPEAALAVAVNMANFLANRRKQIPPPSGASMAAIEAFLANEPVKAVPVNVVEPVAEEPIQAPTSPIPSIMCHPLGSNIQHILEDIDMDSEESVGMGDNRTGPSNVAVERTPRKPCLLFQKQGRVLGLRLPKGLRA
jgi:hypothetical protein